MNSFSVSAAIAAIYMILKTVALYKEERKPELSEMLYVFVASMLGISSMEHYAGSAVAKSIEVFTELP